MEQHDITEKADVIRLVNAFYEQVRRNDRLRPIFEDVAQVDWPVHLPKMYAFWSSLLLGEHDYTGNPMQVHVALSRITPLTAEDFAEWLALFTRTVDELFAGPTAEQAKARGGHIARLMLHKIENRLATSQA